VKLTYVSLEDALKEGNESHEMAIQEANVNGISTFFTIEAVE
jgi:hypothetical protein